MKKLMTTVGAGLALCLAAGAAHAAGVVGVYTYKLVVRDDLGCALSGVETPDADERVSANYTVEAFGAEGGKINATVADAAFGDANVGYNCVLSVPVGDGDGCAKVGERLTLVVTDIAFDQVKFRSSKVLPPVGGAFGIAAAPVGAFHAAPDDTDRGWDLWQYAVGYYLSGVEDGFSIGGPDEDYDGDGLANLREYELGTDPAGGALGVLLDAPEFGIEEVAGRDGVYKAAFAFDPWHVYSIRAIEGAETFGCDGRDLALYEDLDRLDADEPWGTYVFDPAESGRKEFFVRKPAFSSGLLGLAVDGRLQEYIQVGTPSSVAVTPGAPIEFDSEEAARAALAVAEIAPSEAVAAVLADADAADAYKAAFAAEVRQEDGKWILAAELTPEARTNLAASAAAATALFPVAEIAKLPAGATTNAALAGCTPGFYYSLYDAAAVADIAADADPANLNVLCGADGGVVFPNVKKPSENMGFFVVGAAAAASVEPGDRPPRRTPPGRSRE